MRFLKAGSKSAKSFAALNRREVRLDASPDQSITRRRWIGKSIKGIAANSDEWW
jgi:hypothetical protein